VVARSAYFEAGAYAVETKYVRLQSVQPHRGRQTGRGRSRRRVGRPWRRSGHHV